jgi:hypothetical protein
VKDMTKQEIAQLIQAWHAGAAFPVPIVPQFERLDFWYLPRPGAAPTVLVQIAQRAGHRADCADAYVAVSAPLAVETILIRAIIPVGDKARGALASWLQLHYGIGEAEMNAPPSEPNPFLAHTERMQQACDLLNQVLPHVGIVALAVIADSGATWIDAGPLRIRMLPEGWKVARVDHEERAADRHLERLVDAQLLLTELLPLLGIHSGAEIDQEQQTSILHGSIRATPVQSGWRVAIDPTRETPLDLAVPDDCGFDWNDVLDGCIDARNNWRPSAYLHVIHIAVAIGTRAALDFISNYSDDGSPAPDEAVQELAAALNRTAEWEAAVTAGQFTPAT